VPEINEVLRKSKFLLPNIIKALQILTFIYIPSPNQTWHKSAIGESRINELAMLSARRQCVFESKEQLMEAVRKFGINTHKLLFTN